MGAGSAQVLHTVYWERLVLSGRCAQDLPCLIIDARIRGSLSDPLTSALCDPLAAYPSLDPGFPEEWTVHEVWWGRLLETKWQPGSSTAHYPEPPAPAPAPPIPHIRPPLVSSRVQPLHEPPMAPLPSIPMRPRVEHRRRDDSQMMPPAGPGVRREGPQPSAATLWTFSRWVLAGKLGTKIYGSSLSCRQDACRAEWHRLTLWILFVLYHHTPQDQQVATTTTTLITTPWATGPHHQLPHPSSRRSAGLR